MEQYKYIVVGAGQTGLKLATSLAKNLQDRSKTNQRGGLQKVCLVEAGKIGGTYLFGSDLPLKYLAQEAQKIIQNRSHFSESNAELYLQSVANVLEKIKECEQNLQTNLNVYENLFIWQGQASFISKSILEVKSGLDRQLVSFEKAIIASGKNRMHLPEIKGLEEIDFLYQYNIAGLEKLPETLAIVGVTPNNLVIAEIFSAFGCKVTVIEKQQAGTVLAHFDQSVINYALKNLAGNETGVNGVNFMFETGIQEVKVVKVKNSKTKKAIQAIEIKLSSGKSLNFEKIYIEAYELFKDNSLNLSKAGIGYSQDGIFATKYGQTNNKNIYAFGQAVAENNAGLQTKNMADFFQKELPTFQTNLFFGSITSFFSPNKEISEVPFHCLDLFSKVITLGITSQKAKNNYGEMAGSQVVSFVGKEGFIKIVYLKASGKVLGISLAGESAIEFETCLHNLMQKPLKLSDVISIIQNSNSQITL